MRYSTISPGLSDIGAQAPTNEHIERMASVLLTYNFYDLDLGMSPFFCWTIKLTDRIQDMCKECLTSVPPYMSLRTPTKSWHSGVSSPS